MASVRVVLVTGARTWTDDHIVLGALSKQVREHGPFVLVHGGLPVGVDALAHEWLYLDDPCCDLPCCDPNIQRVMREVEEIYPVDVRAVGVDSIPTRNQLMVDRGADLCLAFIGPGSRGSVDCMTRARIAGIPVIERYPEVGPFADARSALCCSACKHPAVEHNGTGCTIRGSIDVCACPGYQVDPMELV